MVLSFKRFYPAEWYSVGGPMDIICCRWPYPKRCRIFSSIGSFQMTGWWARNSAPGVLGRSENVEASKPDCLGKLCSDWCFPCQGLKLLVLLVVVLDVSPQADPFNCSVAGNLRNCPKGGSHCRTGPRVVDCLAGGSSSSNSHRNCNFLTKMSPRFLL